MNSPIIALGLTGLVLSRFTARSANTIELTIQKPISRVSAAKSTSGSNSKALSSIYLSFSF